MINITAPLVASQLPEHLVSDSPIFAEFIRTYYEFCDTLGQGHYQLQNLHAESDIDECPSPIIENFFKMYGDQFPRTVAMDRRNFLKILNAIYEAKGTEKALKLAFRALFDEEVIVTYPGDNRLVASDGVWFREKYVTLASFFGTLPTDTNVVLSFSTDVGDYTFETTRIENINGNYRCYFQSYTNITFDLGQRVYRYDNNGVILYAGTVTASPSYLVVRTPGKNWQVGQVFRAPGTVKDTLARVTKVDGLGGILDVEILEYGTEHSNGQLFTVSPYPNKPNSSAVYVESILTSVSPATFTHTLHVSETISEINERVVGASTSFGASSYFAENYMAEDYIAHIEFYQSAVSLAVVGNIDTGDLTIEEWLASRATLSYEYSPVVQLRGYYKDERGQISNQTIKVQDNYFYQSFSYLIQTSFDQRLYMSLMKIIHPAGTKRFAQLNKNSNIDLSDSVIELNKDYWGYPYYGSAEYNVSQFN